MPIVERVSGEEPLSQGDLLRGLNFVSLTEGGDADLSTVATWGLVLSRPCNALRDPTVVVASVAQFPLDLKIEAAPGQELERMRRRLAGVRDGIRGAEFSDSLYLGPIDSLYPTRRYAADLTRLMTVQVATDAKRQDWVRARRVWRLGEGFLRDLHTRLALTFTRPGHDDYEWYSDADLDIMITSGRRDSKALGAESDIAESAIQQREAANQDVKEQLRKELEKKQQAAARAEEQLQPYLQEKARREQVKATSG